MNTEKLVIADRVEWIDFAKGISIILVIIGHTVGGVLRGAIFSFHMPLFFILSCVTFKYSVNGDQFIKKTERAFRHLIIPAIVMFGLSTMILFIRNFDLFSNSDYFKSFIKERILIGIFSSGAYVHIFSVEIPAIGMPWFLVVLFGGRTLFDYLNLKYDKKKLVMVCIILSVIGVAFGKAQWLPLSFDIALAVLPFFLVGKEYSRFKVENKPFLKLSVSTALWVILLLLSYILTHTYMELACRRYALYPVCYVIAIVGTIMVSEFSVIACRFPKITMPFKYLGKNSLYMFCIHMLDSYLIQWVWKRTNNEYINSLCRVIVDCVIFAVTMLVLESLKKYRRNQK